MKHDATEVIRKSEENLKFKTSRSSGAGGQHVNKVETRVTLRWNLQEAEYLAAVDRTRLIRRLSKYVNKENVFTLTDETTRSQQKNKENVIKRWKKLVLKAFTEPKRRKATSIPKQAKEARLRSKARKSEIKKTRMKPKCSDF